MNKNITALTLSLGLAFSPLCALESTYKKNMQNTSLSQADANFLFASNASHLNVVALSDEEMQKTEGEGVILTAVTTAYKAYKYYETGKQVVKVVKKIKKWFR